MVLTTHQNGNPVLSKSEQAMQDAIRIIGPLSIELPLPFMDLDCPGKPCETPYIMTKKSAIHQRTHPEIFA